MGGVLVGDESGHPILTRILHNVCQHKDDHWVNNTVNEKHKSE